MALNRMSGDGVRRVLLIGLFGLLAFRAAAQEAPPPAPAQPPRPPAAEQAPAEQAAAEQPAPQPAADGADEEDDDTADPKDAAARYAARAAAVQTRMDSLATEVPDETLRARVLEQLKDALAQWQAATQAAEQYARRRQTVEGASARIRAIQEEIGTIRDKAGAAAADDDARPLADLEAELRDLDTNLPEWNKQLDQRTSRIDTQTQRLADSRKAADEAQTRLAAKQPPVPDNLPPELNTAVREARNAHLRADREIIANSDYFRNIQEPVAQLDSAERDLLTRRIEAARARRDVLSNAIADKRREEADTLRRESEAAAARVLEFLPPVFSDVAKENSELSSTLDAFLGQEKNRATALQTATDYNQTLQTDYERIREQVENGNSGQALGSYLWAKRRALQRETYQADQALAAFSSAAVPGFSLGTIDELRRRIPRLDQELSAFSSSKETAALPPARRNELIDQARQLLDNHSRLVTGLAECVQRRSASLIDLDSANKELHRIVGRYGSLVNRHVLQLPGSPPLWEISFVQTFRETLPDLMSVNLWKGVGETLVFGLLRSPWLLFFLLLAALPRVVGRILAGWLARFNISSHKPEAAAPRGLLWRVGRAFLHAYPAPLALFAGGAAIWSAGRPGSDAAAVGDALLAGMFPLLLLNLWRCFCEKDGVFPVYGGMPEVLAERVRRRLGSIRSVGLPLWIVVWFVQNRTEPAAFQTLGGIVSLVLAALAVCFWWLRMRPAVLLRGAPPKSPLFWQIAHLAIMGLSLVWLVLSLLGYNYGAVTVIAKAVASCLVLTFAVLAGLYWDLRLARSRERQRARTILYYRFSEERRLRRDEENRAAAADAADNDDLTLIDHEEAAKDPFSSPAVAAAAASIPPKVEQELEESLAGARRMVRWLVLALLAAALLGQWSDLFPVQEWLSSVTLYSRGEAEGLTLRNLARALAFGLLAALVAVPLGSWANLSFFSWNPSERGTRMATSALIRYGVLGAGAILVARELGMAWSDAQWLVAALSVGLGFGLQEIILNFVSGIILLFERPVRVGDMVTIGSAEGTISRINIRTTTIIDADRRELIIPNKELVTGRVVNWTLSDTVTKVVVSVGVAYGSDLELVQRLLLRAARRTEGVLDDPAPSVFFSSMGDSSLNFDVRAFTGRLEDRGPVQHNLRLSINSMFEKHSISIPFPQIDVHIVPPAE